MLYKDVAKNSGIYAAIFSEINENLNELTNTIVEIKDLDNRFLYENGLKELKIDDLKFYVSVLKAKYFNKWSNLINVVSDLNETKGRTVTTTINSGGVKQNNNISAYDSDDLLTDSQLETTQNSNKTTTRTALNGTSFILNIYNNNYVYDIINTDIRRTLFSNVYTIKGDY